MTELTDALALLKELKDKVEVLERRQKKVIFFLKTNQEGIEAIQEVVVLYTEKKLNDEVIDWAGTLANAVNNHNLKEGELEG